MMSSLDFKKKDPFIGIMTSRKEGQQLIGNIPLFRSIQEELVQMGGVSVIFSAEDLSSTGINGAIFDPNKQSWEPISAPLPQLVYNRVPFRREEATPSFIGAVQFCRKHSIPFFNPSFLNKYESYLLFKDHPELKQFFLPTVQIRDKYQLREFLSSHQTIYIKQAASALGKGIHRIHAQNDHTISFLDKKKQMVYKDFDHYWMMWREKFYNKPYIAQQAVKPLLYNGSRFDFRILAIFDGVKHVPVGVGVRQSGEQQLTTHIPNGGNLLHYSLFQTVDRDEKINKIVELCGKALSKKWGFFGEFSIDLGLTTDEEYVIYEINSKPMSFDEEDIEKKRIRMLCELFRLLKKK
jgi:hypothetical protein